MSSKIKSIICILICLIVALSMFGCKSEDTEESKKTKGPVANINDAAEGSSSPTSVATAQATDEPFVEQTAEPTVEKDNNTANPTSTAKPTNTLKPTSKPTVKKTELDVSSLPDAVDFSAAKYTDNVLKITNSAGVSIGSYNLSEVSSVVISYGADPNANISNDEIHIKDASGNTISSDFLVNSDGAFWADGVRDIELYIDSSYSGEIFITKDNAGNNIAISAITLVSDSGASIKTPKPVSTPAVTSKPTIENEQLVKNLMAEAQKVTDYMRANKFKYGDAKINPAYNWGALDVSKAINPSEKIVSCDRLIDWILYRVGFTDQMYTQGMTVGNLDEWCEEYGFKKITNVNSLQAGDIVFVNPHPGGWAKHVFMCASSKGSDGKWLRYDAGSDARITGTTGTEVKRGKQPFREGISQFMYAYRPCVDKMPTTNTSIYNKPSTTAAVPKSGATEVFNNSGKTWDGGVSLYGFNYKYEPGKGYKQYELHLTLQSAPSTSDKSYWNSCYVGARIPNMSSDPTSKGGVWVAFTGTKATVYFGTGSPWNVSDISVSLPADVSTAQKIIVVDNGDMIKYYHVSSSNTRKLILTVTVDSVNDKVVVWDGNNNVEYIGVGSFNTSGYFSTWNHIANSTISNISIKGAN